ncbi:MAG: DUF6263 family protein [Myxococcota bacterium]
MSWLPVIPRTLVALFVAVVVFVLPASAADNVQIKLLEAGSGEKIQLRATPKKGTSESLVMLMNIDMAMDMGGMGKMPATLPQMKMVMKADVTDVKGDQIHYTFTLTEASISKDGADPMMIAAMEPELAKMVGTKGNVVVNDRGVTQSAKIIPPEGTSTEEMGQFENMQKSMNHASAPLPVEPVGVGAKWSVTTGMQENGIALQQVVTYTVKSIQGRVVTLDTALVQNADQQKLSPAGMPPGSEASLDSLKSTGTGQTVIDLDHLFPNKGTLTHDMTTRMTVKAEGQTMTMGMDMKLGLDMSRK